MLRCKVTRHVPQSQTLFSKLRPESDHGPEDKAKKCEPTRRYKNMKLEVRCRIVARERDMRFLTQNKPNSCIVADGGEDRTSRTGRV
jgi:hypothetical protein